MKKHWFDIHGHFCLLIITVCFIHQVSVLHVYIYNCLLQTHPYAFMGMLVLHTHKRACVVFAIIHSQEMPICSHFASA